MSELNQLTDHAFDVIINLARVGECVSTDPVRGTEAEQTEDSNQRLPEPIRRHASDDLSVDIKVDLLEGETLLYTMAGTDFIMSIAGPYKEAHMNRGVVFKSEDMLNLLINT